MAILDIRKEQKEEINGVRFDETDDLISWDENIVMINDSYHNETGLFEWPDFDNFIAALHKAKELAGK